LPPVVDDLAGFRAIAEALGGDRGMNHAAGQTPARLVIGRIHALTLEDDADFHMIADVVPLRLLGKT
jgi:hypothetical protein